MHNVMVVGKVVTLKKPSLHIKPRKISQVKEDGDSSSEVVNDGQPVNMEVDTGAAVTVVSEKTCKVNLQPTKTKLKSATGQTMPLVGEAMVQAEVGDIKRKVKLFIAKRNCRGWFYGENWVTQVNVLEYHKPVTNITAKV